MNRMVWCILFVFLSLPGCISLESVVKVKRDGTGIVQERLLLSQETVDFMKKMQVRAEGQEGAAGRKAAEVIGQEFFKTQNIVARATEMGEGVSYLKSRKIAGKEGEGYEAEYFVPDLSKLRYTMNRPSPSGEAKPRSSLAEVYYFSVTQGEISRLVIKIPELKGDSRIFPLQAPQKDEKPPSSEDASPDDKEAQAAGGMKEPDEKAVKGDAGISDIDRQMEAMKLVKVLFKGLRIYVAVECEGTITATDADIRDGKRLVLLDFDLDRLEFSADDIQRCNQNRVRNLKDMQQIMKDIKGLRMETKKEVWVDFK